MTDAAFDSISSAAARDARGRFQPGCSGNPAGKKPGTLNRATILKRVMAEGDEERIASLIVERALKGEWAALRFVQDRLEPKPRTRPIALDFPESATVAEMSEIVLRAMADGEISPDEAIQIMRLLDKVEAQRCTAWAAAVVAGEPVPATRPTVARRPDPPPADAVPAPDLHSASIATPPPRDPAPAEPAVSSTRRRRAATSAVAAAIGALPGFAALVADAGGRADALHSTCNLEP
jgi:Family of unknown function (DUF5681)